MESEIIKNMLLNPPDNWILLEDTSHAFRYAADIWQDEVKYLELELQYNQIQQLYEEFNKYPNRDLDQLASLAFQIQFLRECIQEIHRLIEVGQPSMFK